MRDAERKLGLSVCLVATLLVGCGGKKEITPPPRIGWVRISPLAARHPLMVEVARLRRAEQEFERLAAQGGITEDIVSLPALPPPGLVRENNGLATRRAVQRRQLRQAAAQGLRRFAEGRQARQQRLIEQRRLELDAAFRARDADTERLARLEVESETARQLSALAEQRLQHEARIAYWDGQLAQENLTIGPVLQKDLEAEVSRLFADPKAKGISPRARITWYRKREQAKLDMVIASTARVTQQGQDRVADLVARAQNQREQEIEAALRGLRGDATLATIGVGQQDALQKVLTAEQRAARLERQVMQSAGQQEQSAGPLVSGGLANADAAAPGLRSAAQRIRRQRLNLQQFIRESVAEAVRDTAHQQNITVTLVSDETLGSAPRGGGSDLTAAFLRWIRWGEPLPRATREPQVKAVDGGKDKRA